MRNSPQSPTGSVSSCSTPVPLHAHWTHNNTTNRNTPTRNLDNNTTTSNSSSNNNNVEHVDDDLFGSAAWRKKRVSKRGTKTGPENAEDKPTNANRWTALRLIEDRAQELRNRIEVVKTWVGIVLRKLRSPSSPVRLPAVPAVGLARTTLPSPGSYELTSEALVQQARLLCGSYIYHRLCSKGLMNKRVHVAPYHSVLAEELSSAGQEMERLYPRVYSDVSRRIAMTMSSAQLVRRALTTVLEGTFSMGVTWAKVVSMVVISAAFAEECVVQGHPSFVEDVVMCVGHFVMLNLTGWLTKQGGWAAFPTSRPPVLVKASERSPMMLYAALLLVILTILVLGLFKFYLGIT